MHLTMSTRMVLKTIKNKGMGRSYNLKKSPINKGTAAKPSPMKEPIITAALIGLAATALGAGASAVQGSKNRKKQEKIAKEQEAAAATQSAQAGLSKNLGGGKTRIA